VSIIRILFVFDRIVKYTIRYSPKNITVNYINIFPSSQMSKSLVKYTIYNIKLKIVGLMKHFTDSMDCSSIHIPRWDVQQHRTDTAVTRSYRHWTVFLQCCLESSDLLCCSQFILSIQLCINNTHSQQTVHLHTHTTLTDASKYYCIANHSDKTTHTSVIQVYQGLPLVPKSLQGTFQRLLEQYFYMPDALSDTKTHCQSTKGFYQIIEKIRNYKTVK